MGGHYDYVKRERTAVFLEDLYGSLLLRISIRNLNGCKNFPAELLGFGLNIPACLLVSLGRVHLTTLCATYLTFLFLVS